MTKLTDYQVRKILYQSKNTVVFRGIRLKDKLPVVIKSPVNSDHVLGRDKRIAREFNLGSMLSSEFVITYYQTVQSSFGLTIVTEDIDGEPLHKMIPESGMSLDDFFPLAIQMARGLAEIHRLGVVHKDVKPGNILVYGENRIKFIDFGISSNLRQEYQQNVPLNRLEGTIAYISPEQTGRMNRMLDYRTDIYSLGITFYQMLTGRIPFDSEDALELIHSHLALHPEPVHRVRRDVPKTLSLLLARMMEKSADARYQSVYGIEQDLKRCLGQWDLVGKITPFPLAQDDQRDHLAIPQKLYGRAEDLARLEAELDKVTQGGRGMVLISGPTGVGKTNLVLELEKKLTEVKGQLAMGKFSEYSSNSVFSGFTDAFHQLLQNLLGEDEVVVARWREVIQKALGDTAMAIAWVFPDLRLILTDLPTTTKSAHPDNMKQFHDAIARLMACFASPERPLLLFLDNLQWADRPSLELLTHLMMAENINGLFLVAAARSEASAAGRILKLRMELLEQIALDVPQIHLQPLNMEQLTQLVADTLKQGEQLVRPLAEIIHGKTRGNPYFTFELLKNFHNAGLIFFDVKKQAWGWKEDGIRSATMPDTLADLVITRLDRLPPKACRVLQLAACLGMEFDHTTLAHCSGFSAEETAEQLALVLELNLIIPLKSHEDLDLNSEDVLEEVHFQFQHHRVRQSTYQMLSETRKRQFHLQIARYMRAHGVPRGGTTLAYHYNEAKSLIHDRDELIFLAELNLQNANKSFAAVAYRTALNFLKLGIDCLPDNPWETCYRLCYDLHFRHSEAAYLAGEFDLAQMAWTLLLEHAQDALDRTRVLELQMVHHMSNGRFKEAISLGLESTKRLGFKLPEKPTRLQLMAEFTRVRWALKRTTLEYLAQAPANDDLVMQACINILMRLNLACYFHGENELYAFVTLSRVRLAILYGNSPETASAFITYGLLLTITGHYRQALEYGQLGLELDQRFGYLPLRCKALFNYAFCIHSWHHHLKTMTPILQEAIDAGVQTGDHLYCTLASMMITFWDPTFTLPVAFQKGRDYLSKIKSRGYRGRVGVAELLQQYHLCLMGKTNSRFTLDSDNFDEQGCLDAIRDNGFRAGLALYHCVKLELGFLYGSFADALVHLEAADRQSKNLSGTPYVPRLVFFSFLTVLATHRDQKLPGSKLRKLKQQLRLMKEWVELCPANLEHCYHLMLAEYQGHQGRDWDALKNFRLAVETAQKNQYLAFVGIAAETAARFFLSKGHSAIARAYLLEADAAYLAWGASAKVEHIRITYPTLLMDRRILSHSHHDQEASAQSDDQMVLPSEDLSTVIKISGALSSEMNYARLCDKLLKTLMETTRAEKALLVIREEGRMKIEALLIRDKETDYPNIPLDKSNQLCQRAVRESFTRNRYLLISDALTTTPFNQDAYVVREGIRGMLVAPIRVKDEVSGVIYLESARAPNVFQEKDVDWLKIFTGPAAISLENARLFTQSHDAAQEVETLNQELARLNEDLEARVLERTSELERVQRKLVERAHYEGMSEIATSVLQNVGSILNSVMTSSKTLHDTVEGSRMMGLLKANRMLADRMSSQEQVAHFLAEDAKGQTLVRYYLGLEDPFLKETATIENNTSRLITLVERIREVILAQQSYARAGVQLQTMRLSDVVNDALSILSGGLARSNINVERHYPELKPIELARNKVIHLLVHVVQNAIEAMEETAIGERHLIITISEEEIDGSTHQVIHLKDSGKGIPAEDMENIFAHGFSTRQNPGFGLHATANAMTEMGGNIKAFSEGEGKGATFTLNFPLTKPLLLNDNSL